MARKATVAKIRPHRIAVPVFNGVVPFDLAIPSVFERVQGADGRALYQVQVCGPEVDAGHFRLRPRFGLAALSRADTVVLPGIDDIDKTVPPALLRAVRGAAARGARVVSICSGAFVLAATGLLDGRRATTHWLAAAELARRHPAITVDPEVLYVDEGAIATSAGAAAGMDLCLHLIRRDHGAAVAAHAARCAVMPLLREGGQAQFIEPTPAPENALEPLLRWMETHLDQDLDLATLAARAGQSTRSLSRHFRHQVGTTPAQWVLRARVRRAQQLLEQTPRSMEQIADAAGFGSSAAFRAHFRRVVGTSPRAYRTSFRPARAA